MSSLGNNNNNNNSETYLNVPIRKILLQTDI